MANQNVLHVLRVFVLANELRDNPGVLARYLRSALRGAQVKENDKIRKEICVLGAILAHAVRITGVSLQVPDGRVTENPGKGFYSLNGFTNIDEIIKRLESLAKIGSHQMTH